MQEEKQKYSRLAPNYARKALPLKRLIQEVGQPYIDWSKIDRTGHKKERSNGSKICSFSLSGDLHISEALEEVLILKTNGCPESGLEKIFRRINLSLRQQGYVTSDIFEYIGDFWYSLSRTKEDRKEYLKKAFNLYRFSVLKKVTSSRLAKIRILTKELKSMSVDKEVEYWESMFNNY